MNSVKYYVRFNNIPVLAIKVYEKDGKYYRFLALISSKKDYSTRIITKGNRQIIRKVLISPKIAASNYIKEIGDSWAESGFTKISVPKNFTENIKNKIRYVMEYTYGFNKNVTKYNPVRYESDVKLFDWEFRMFNKPKS